jgi:endothelin-converting enzyme/putative endopeptidase
MMHSKPIPGVHIKGQLTLGENLGDLGGLEVAYSAYRRYVAAHGEPPVIGGLTGDQRFFIAYGYSWETKQREGALRAQLLTNEHSPAKYRVNGVVRNVGRLVQGVQRPARRQDVPAAGAAGSRLVG